MPERLPTATTGSAAQQPWSPRQALGTRLFALVLSLLGWAMQVGWTRQPVFPLDDAYITLTNAASLWSGASSYDSPALAGATSLLHVLLVAALMRLTSPELAVAGSCLLGCIAYALGLVELARALHLKPRDGCAIAFVGSSVGFSQYQLFSGLETGLAMAAVVWTLVLLVQRRRLLLDAFCGLLPWIRPDLLPLALLCLALREPVHGSARLVQIVRGCAVAGLATLPLLAVQWLQTGHLLPTTSAAKAYFFAEGCLPAADRLHTLLWSMRLFAIQMTLLPISLLLALPARRRDRAVAVSLSFLAALVLAYGSVFPSGLGHNASRYLYPTVPVLVALLAAAMASRSSRRRPRAARLLLLALVVVCIVRDLPKSDALGAAGRRYTQQGLADVAGWLRGRTPADSIVLVHDAGYVAYRSERRLVDLVGLKSPDLIDLHRTSTYASCGKGRGAAVLRIVATVRPDYLVVLREWDRVFAITGAFPSPDFLLERVHLDATGQYDIYRVRRRTPETAE